jgi:hypothetical protein
MRQYILLQRLAVHLVGSEENKRFQGGAERPDRSSRSACPGRMVETRVTLSEHPEIGRIVPEFGQTFLRKLIHPPFRIIYPVDPALSSRYGSAGWRISYAR